MRKLDVENIAQMAPTAKKTGYKVKEVRDTVNPRLMTEMMMAILASLGNPVPVPQILKRVRDDSVWENALIPWRRSSYWLATRVAIQSSLSRMLPGHQAPATYKNLMTLLHTKILDLALASELPIDLCWVIQAKIARRSVKLSTALLTQVETDASLGGQRFKNKAEAEWQKAQDYATAVNMKVDISYLDDDTTMTLDTCRQYLKSMMSNELSIRAESSIFMPACPNLLTYAKDELPQLPSYISGDDLLFSLAKFEIWIHHHLATWTSAIHTPNSAHCSRLASLAAEYKKRACAAYIGCPDQLSTMLLTIVELWVSLDRIATKILPLLCQFAPELPDGIFNPLLLAKKDHMSRLKVVEEYVRLRQDGSNAGNASIFADPVADGKPQFPSLFYDSSEKSMALKQRIETNASEQWAAKQLECENKQNEFDKLKAKAANLSCTTVADDWGIERHSPGCTKCNTEKQAAAMTIEIYEWPLPEDEAQCRAVIFELACPPAFSAWRNLTWMLVHELGQRGPRKGESIAATLFGYDGLRAYKNDMGSRLNLASPIKSNMQSHYSKLNFPTTPSQLLRKNGLKYAYVDILSQAWVREQAKHPSFAEYCESRLPNGPYSSLQFAVDSVANAQNKVVAEQSYCSKYITLHELIAFGSLRADGEETQWYNILRELEASNLSLNTQAVCTLITQAANQAGSRSNTELRLSHDVFNDSQFCSRLLKAVEMLLDSIGRPKVPCCRKL